MLLYIEGIKIGNKTKCTPNFKMQGNPVHLPSYLFPYRVLVSQGLRDDFCVWLVDVETGTRSFEAVMIM